MKLQHVALSLAVCPSLAFAAGTDVADLYTGEVVIETASDGRVLVTVDTTSPASPADGIVDHVFVLQVGAEAAPAVSRSLASAQVLHREGHLQISTKEGETWVLTLESGDRIESREATTIAGFGLSHHSGDFSTLGTDASPWGLIRHFSDPAATESRSPSYPGQSPEGLCPDGGGGVYCTAGGCGASQCSLSTGTITCSVTCNEGHFACCNQGGSCKCTSNTYCLC